MNSQLWEAQLLWRKRLWEARAWGEWRRKARNVFFWFIGSLLIWAGVIGALWARFGR